MDGGVSMLDSEKKKLKGQQCDDGGVEDRLSSLPDSLIHHILSFVPTKYVVATSVLSTRWLYLWASSSNIDIYDQLLYSTGSASDDPMVMKSFMNFVDRVLALQHAPTLTKFCLSGEEVYDDSRVNAWISIALRCNVQELILSIPLEKPFVSPRSIFNCESLTKLTISMSDVFHLKISKLMCFPNLKHLHLSSILFCGDHSTQKVFFSFPVLEEFTAYELRLFKITTVKMSAPLLKRLAIDHDDESDEIQGHGKIIIDAQSLVYLKFSESLRCDYSIYGKSSILDAYFFVWSIDYLIELLKGISNVRNLNLHGRTAVDSTSFFYTLI